MMVSEKDAHVGGGGKLDELQSFVEEDGHLVSGRDAAVGHCCQDSVEPYQGLRPGHVPRQN